VLTENAAASERPLDGLVGFKLLVAADDAVLHVVVFQDEAKQFESMSALATAVAELRVTPTARHVIAALRPLDVHLIVEHTWCKTRHAGIRRQKLKILRVYFTNCAEDFPECCANSAHCCGKEEIQIYKHVVLTLKDSRINREITSNNEKYRHLLHRPGT